MGLLPAGVVAAEVKAVGEDAGAGPIGDAGAIGGELAIEVEGGVAGGVGKRDEMPGIGGPSDGRAKVGGLGAVGLGGEGKVGAGGIKVKRPPAVGGIGGVEADIDQSAKVAGAGAIEVGAGPVGLEPEAEGAGFQCKIGAAVALNQLVVDAGRIGAVHLQGVAIPGRDAIEVGPDQRRKGGGGKPVGVVKAPKGKRAAEDGGQRWWTGLGGGGVDGQAEEQNG